MSSPPLLDRFPSTWRLATLQGLTVAVSLALYISLTDWVLRKDLDANAREEVHDDLCEHAAVFADCGQKSFDLVFKAGIHATDEASRLVSPDGANISEHLPIESVKFTWPEASQLSQLPQEPDAIAIERPRNGMGMVLGRQRLNDGIVLWHGRLDTADEAALAEMRRYLLLGVLAAGFVALAPLFWYARQVRLPVQRMINSANTLARGNSDARLEAQAAVPELREFATAFNTVLDRNHQLAAELQAANDHLAHELRTPLSRIRGRLEAVSRLSPGTLGADAAESGLDEIDRASDLIQRILTVRAGDHGALQLHREALSLRELLAGTVEMYQASAEERDLRLSLEAEADSVLPLDRQYFLQALANLLDNALAYTPSGGSVTVKLKQQGECVTVQVEDSGPGLHPDETQQIWQRFVRGSVASARAPGMGLGLSLVRAIACAHGGRCGCHNRSDGQSGAVFWIELPLGESVISKHELPSLEEPYPSI